MRNFDAAQNRFASFDKRMNIVTCSNVNHGRSLIAVEDLTKHFRVCGTGGEQEIAEEAEIGNPMESFENSDYVIAFLFSLSPFRLFPFPPRPRQSHHLVTFLP